MVLYSSWLCHSSGLNINVSSFIVICEARIAFTIKGPISLELQRNRPHIFGDLSIVFLKKDKIFMSGMKKAKCYKKSGVKVWFGRLGNADKYWLESFRDYTIILGGNHYEDQKTDI